MKTMKKIALIALGLAEIALPVIMLVGGAFVAAKNTFWCASLVACAIAFIVFAIGKAVGKEKDWNKFFQLTALSGAIASFLVLAVEFLYFGYISNSQLPEPWPMMMSMWYLFTVVTVLLFTVIEWHKEDKKAKFFLTCAVMICASIAMMAGLSLLDLWFSWQLVDSVGEIIGYITGTTIIVLMVGIAGILADNTMNGQNKLIERWASACGAIVCIGFVGAMLTDVIGNYVADIPDALQKACLWLIGGGFIGLLFSAVIALISKK